jgi:LPXTG-motif cell wall-anchored protein
MRRHFVGILAVGCFFAGASPVYAATSSTFTEYARPRVFNTAEQSVLGNCDAVAQFPGSSAAAGAADGSGWTLDTSTNPCAGPPDQTFFVLGFMPVRCSKLSGITAMHMRVMTLPGQSTSASDPELALAMVHGGALTVGYTGSIGDGGGVTDFNFAPAIPSALSTILDPSASYVLALVLKSSNFVYKIDAISWSITGDLSTCHVDQDGDDLDNVAEAKYGTNPLKADTDGGGVDDGTEVARRSDPLDARDDATGHPPTTTVAPLPRTGSAAMGSLAWLAVVAVALGGTLTVVSRKRRAPG